MAVHFSSVTNASAALQEGDIPRTLSDGPNLTRLVTDEQVELRLRGFKIPNSRVSGDIPKHLIKPLAKELSKPLAAIFNVCFVNEIGRIYGKLKQSYRSLKSPPPAALTI